MFQEGPSGIRWIVHSFTYAFFLPCSSDILQPLGIFENTLMSKWRKDRRARCRVSWKSVGVLRPRKLSQSPRNHFLFVERVQLRLPIGVMGSILFDEINLQTITISTLKVYVTIKNYFYIYIFVFILYWERKPRLVCIIWFPLPLTRAKWRWNLFILVCLTKSLTLPLLPILQRLTSLHFVWAELRFFCFFLSRHQPTSRLFFFLFPVFLTCAIWWRRLFHVDWWTRISNCNFALICEKNCTRWL